MPNVIICLLSKDVTWDNKIEIIAGHNIFFLKWSQIAFKCDNRTMFEHHNIYLTSSHHGTELSGPIVDKLVGIPTSNETLPNNTTFGRNIRHNITQYQF